MDLQQILSRLKALGSEFTTAQLATLALTFVHPEISQPGGGGTGQSGDEQGVDADGLPERSLDIRLTYQVTTDSLEIITAIANRARRPLTFELAWTLGADFADIQEAQAGRREQEAGVDVASTEANGSETATTPNPSAMRRSMVGFQIHSPANNPGSNRIGVSGASIRRIDQRQTVRMRRESL